MKDRDQFMKDEDEQTSKGLNQIVEIINAKGDKGEGKNIVNQGHEKNLICSDELFDKELRVIVNDTAREDE